MSNIPLTTTQTNSSNLGCQISHAAPIPSTLSMSTSHGLPTSMNTSHSIASLMDHTSHSIAPPVNINQSFSGLGVLDSDLTMQPHIRSQNRKLGTPLGQFTPLSVKEKIWKGEFIDLGSLIQQDTSTDESLTLSLIRLDNNQIGFKQNKPRVRPIFNIDLWTQAFLVFSAIYLQKHPTRAIELLQYMDTIRKLARRFSGNTWILYDKEFRMGQAFNPNRSWGCYDADLLLDKLTVVRTDTTSSFQPNSQRNVRYSPYDNRNRVGSQAKQNPSICFAFNSKNGCFKQPCRYTHKCLKCNKQGHSSAVCTFQRNMGQLLKQPFQSKREDFGKGKNTN